MTVIEAANEIIAKQARVIAKMHGALLQCDDYFDNRADVVDGYGEPAPNTEMQILSEVRTAIAACEGMKGSNQ